MVHKIATCSYCGTRAALVLDKARHELACRACGAPLHEMKAMPQVSGKKRKKSTYQAPPQSRPKQREAREEWRDWPARKRRKKRKPLARRVLEELWDTLEDVFD